MRSAICKVNTLVVICMSTKCQLGDISPDEQPPMLLQRATICTQCSLIIEEEILQIQTEFVNVSSFDRLSSAQDISLWNQFQINAIV